MKPAANRTQVDVFYASFPALFENILAPLIESNKIVSKQSCHQSKTGDSLKLVNGYNS